MGDQPRSVRRRGLSLFAVGISFALLAAACSSDDTTSADGGASSATGGAGAVEDLGSTAPATGSPVTIGLISASGGDSPLAAQFKKLDQGMRMAVAYANDYKGGLGGHKIDLFICQGGETPAGSQACANEMVNKGAVAVVQPFTSQGASMVPILTAAKIPYIGLSGASQPELFTQGSYIFSGGLPVLFAATADFAAKSGIKNFAMLITNGAGVVDGVSAFARPAFEKKGIKFTVTPVGLDVADMIPQLQAAADGGADAIGMIGDVTFCSKFLQGYQSLGLDQQRYLLGTCVDPTVTKAYGDLIKGSVGLGGSANASGDPDVKLFASIAAKYSNGEVDPDIGKSGGQLASVLPLMTLVNLFQGSTGPLDGAAVGTKISTTPKIPLFLGGGATVTCDGKAVPVFVSLCGTSAAIGELNETGMIENAKLVDYKDQLAGP